MTRTPSPFGSPLDMLGQVPPPARWTPFGNMNVGGGMTQGLLQMLLPALAQSMGGPQNFPAQFLPSQNVWDQFQAQRYWQGQQQAMAWATNLDVASMHRTITGAHRMLFDRVPTSQEQQQYRGMAETAGQWLPVAEMFLGPEKVDAAMGPGGSATILASRLHRGMRNVRDPFTGAMGVRGRTAGLMAQEMYGQLFGPGANLAEMQGMSAGQGGALFEQLQQRGMAGVDLGARTPVDRLRALAGGDFQRVGTQRRIAEAYLRGQGKDVTTGTIEAVREEVFGQGGTLGEIRAGITGGNIDVQRLMEMPGTEELLSVAQGQTISRRLKNMSGAVSAMQDIFGDALGRKGTMQEIIQGLQALTQGGLASMSPGQVEQIVRTTKNLAQVSGLGIQGMLGLQAQGGNLADQLGLDRTLAIGATQLTAAGLIAAKQTQRFDMPVFGGFAAEEYAILSQRLNMGTMASQTTNTFAAALRLQEMGVIQADTDADRLTRAIQARETKWTNAAGERLSVAMNDADFARVMQTGGMNRAAIEDILADRYGNQRLIRDQNLVSYGRAFQGEVDIEPFLSNVFGNRMARQLHAQGVGGVLNQNQRRAAAAQVARQVRQLAPETRNDPVLFDQAVGDLTIEALIAQAPNPRAARTLRNAFDPQGITVMGGSLVAGANLAIRNDERTRGFKSLVGALQMTDDATTVRRNAELAEAQTRGRMQAVMSSIGRQSPIPRLIGAMQAASEGGDWDAVLRDIMGFVPTQGAGAGIGIVVERYRQAERYTLDMVHQEEMDREIAMQQGDTLGEYRARIQQAAGDERARLTGERDRQRADLRGDPVFFWRMHENRRAIKSRVGTLTKRGEQQQEFWTTIMEALDAGGQQAEQARLMITREVGGADIETGDMPAEWWEAKAAAAGTPAGRRRVEELRQASDSLWLAQRGETIDVQRDGQEAPGEGTTGPADVGRLILGDPLSRQASPVNRLPGGAGGGGDGQDRRITARMSGTLTITGDQAVIAGDMELGDFEHNDVQTNMVSGQVH